MQDIIIYGAGSVGLLAEQIIFDINVVSKKYNLIGYLDDDPEKIGTIIIDKEVLGDFRWLTLNSSVSTIVGFSDPNARHSLVNKLISLHVDNFVTLIHPDTWIARRVNIGNGSIIYPGVKIDVDVTIGQFCIINKLVSIGHNTIIEDYCTLSPGVNIGGFNRIGHSTEIGINSCSIQYRNIGKNSIVGAGSVIVKDIPDHVIAFGNPARTVRIKN